jgi:signal transduction histidine kinase
VRSPRPSRADWAWVAGLLAGGVADWAVALERLDRPALSLAAVVAGSIAFLARPRWPVGVPLAVAIATFVLEPAIQANELVWSVAIYAAAVVLVSIELRGRRLALAIAALVAADNLPQIAAGLPDDYWTETAWSLTALVPGVIAGRVVGSQRDLARALDERNAELDREAERLAEAARAEERARIARELHDVVAHSVSLMVVQAGAARRVLDRDAGRASSAFRLVASTGHEALDEMSWLLGVLDPDEAESATSGVDRVRGLVERARSAGLPIALEVSGDPVALDERLELVVYRVVQEALTNVLKHASGASACVALRWLQDGLEVEVADEGGAPAGFSGGGRGIDGMRERVGRLGGSLDAAPRAGGGFVVSARFPLAEVVA